MDKTTAIALRNPFGQSTEAAWAEYRTLTTEEKALVWAKGSVQTYQHADPLSTNWHVGQSYVRMLERVYGLRPVYAGNNVVDFEPGA